MAQKQMVIRYLNEHGSITTLEACMKLYICDLQKIIQLLKRDYDIDSVWIHKTNIYGKRIKFKKYFVRGNKQIEQEN